MLFSLGLAHPVKDKDYLAVRREFELLHMSLKFNNSTIELKRDAFTKHIDANGFPVWEFRFPADPAILFSAGS
jgi:hypothetical protein